MDTSYGPCEMVNACINHLTWFQYRRLTIPQMLPCVFNVRDYLLSHDIAVQTHVRVQTELQHVVKEASGGQTGSHGPAIDFKTFPVERN